VSEGGASSRALYFKRAWERLDEVLARSFKRNLKSDEMIATTVGSHNRDETAPIIIGIVVFAS
jgi:hypothetical protein